MRNKPTVGQALYALNVGNSARRRVQMLKPVTVISVGRKFFKAKGNGDRDHMAVSYFLDTWAQDSGGYCAGWKLYESAQEWEDERESARINEVLRNGLGGYGEPKFPLERLRAAHRALYAFDIDPKPEKGS